MPNRCGAQPRGRHFYRSPPDFLEAPLKAEIYSRPGCGDCVAAKALMVMRAVTFTGKNVSNAETCAEMMRRMPTARAVPQIFLDGQHFGGFDDLARLLQA